ncbi:MULTISPECIES: nicotinate (nicotinamide) nucleotide adenylyltransferase [Alteromonas]|uniref:nicotinate (nicotinamide) nucleotide adenylyltransferase n=1 Tax=Alteromonas TaxID=226 RepID=UPI000720EA66|nr:MULTISPECIES: nicotinate (nicotinamide) nucleotide adenylyltransferase [Alteromonas]ALM90798.1 Nicotinate-nucleotide adenylyltransferase [Alteromonas stellipolaris LMG 21856]MDO6538094.1 nicotinate (nicotinamide) nucleotide adenylyltransferase [Alteromonas stellipolaris]
MAICAILGGTFNPPHLGHVSPALHLLSELNIDALGLMPCKLAPHKAVAVSEKHRVNMVKLCCEQDKRLYPELIELSLASPSYTVKTLRALKERDNKTICFFIGADSLYNLKSWFEWERLLDFCHLVVMRRDSDTFTPPDDLVEWLKANKTEDVLQLHAQPNGLVFLADTPLHPVSSTQLRSAVQTNASSTLQETHLNETALHDAKFQATKLIAKWLPKAVADYIHTHRLYQELSNK